MNRNSLMESGRYTKEWVEAFYTQGSIWWGPDVLDEKIHTERVDLLRRWAGSGRKRILELGAGAGRTAEAMAREGHSVLGIDLSPLRVDRARPLPDGCGGDVTMVCGDFYTAVFDGRFDVICYWDGFGVGADADQRRLLKRMSGEWLAPDGCVIMDVYNPVKAARTAGRSLRLPPLPGVKESVEMDNRTHFDPVRSCWIDEWIPVAEPEKALAQAIRCYTPADLMLLLDGTGLVITNAEVGRETIDPYSDRITTSSPLIDSWNYVVELRCPRGGAGESVD
jgi:SAM-dependent methyltransferase